MSSRRRSFSPVLAVGLGVSAVVAFALTSSAQEQGAGPTDNGGNNGGNGGSGSAGGNGSGSSAPVQVGPPPVYGVVAPPAPGEPIGGGNATESSARPVTGDKEDSFDLNQPSGDTPTTYYGGSGRGAVFFQDHARSTVVGAPAAAPSTHLVQKGETLWGICDQSFNNPYLWPRIWSYNPQIQNPHWIYPNEQVRLKAGVPLTSAAPNVRTPMEGGGSGGAMAIQGRMAPGTVYLRDQGFVNDDATLNWGSIVGSPLDKMYLSDTDETYVRVGPGHDVKIGQELTVFRPIRAVGDGQVITLQGTLRVDDWNPQTRIARAQVVETLDAIERGARVGPVTRSFEVIAPKRNTGETTAHVMISTQTHVFYGQNQVVFIDRGADGGLEPGNRLFIVRRGDAWRQSMVTDQTARRISGETEDHAVMENTPRLRNENALPEEVTAELLVLDVQKKSATCLVTQSIREIEPGELAVERKGY
jgi:hypothetical protein